MSLMGRAFAARRSHWPKGWRQVPPEAQLDLALSIIRRESGMGLARTRKEHVGAGPVKPANCDLGFTPWPEVTEYLTAEVYPGGEKRQTASLLLFVEGGKLKACLSDRDTGRVAFVAASSWIEVMDVLEGGLRDGSLDWRMSRSARPK